MLLFFLKSVNNTQPVSIKKKIAQGNILHVIAQNPATSVVAGNSRGGILRVKTIFQPILPKTNIIKTILNHQITLKSILNENETRSFF